MDIRLILYFTDKKGNDYCFSCATKEIIANGTDIDITGTDITGDGNDMRKTPECCKCGKYFGWGYEISI